MKPSNRTLRQRWNTLKVKLTVYYAAGFLVSLVFSFTTLLMVQRHLLLKNVHKKVGFFLNEFTYEYLAGKEFPHAATFIKPERLPDEALAMVQRRWPGAVLRSSFWNVHRCLEMIVTHGDEVLSVTFSADRSRIEEVARLAVDDRVEYIHYEFNEESYGESTDQFFFMLLAPDGRVLARSPFSASFLRPLLEGRTRYGGAGRLLTVEVPPTRVQMQECGLYDGNVLLVGESLQDFDKNMRRLFLIFSACLVITLVIGVLTGYVLAQKACRVINRVAAAAREIESGDFSKRVPVTHEAEELDRLIAAFNDMTGKTGRLVAELKTISENIAHDLRTPLTRMHGKAELALISGGDTELAGVIAEECSDMLEMINTMLEITQIEYNMDAVRTQLVDLREMVGKSIELFSTLAEDKEIALSCELPDVPVMFQCSASKFQRMIANLVDNALKFTPRGGRVEVCLRKFEKGIVLRVADTGCGIEMSEQAHIFDRFFRSSLSRSTPGNGLGLSFVRAVVLSHNGTVRVESVPGEGTTFVVALPLAEAKGQK